MESPPSGQGSIFGTTDNDLEIIVRPGHTQHWKNEQSFARRVGHGVYSAEKAESFYADGQQTIQAV
ncbi:MAG: hypothetical protein VX910_06340 [Candidatus Latescibacterota bacterium]|nr:hypothetical protein [Candidatus Latescibacterota bacterium]